MIKLICILILSFFALSVFDYNSADACEPDLKISLKINKPKRTISSAKKKAKVKFAAKAKKKNKSKITAKQKTKSKSKVSYHHKAKKRRTTIVKN